MDTGPQNVLSPQRVKEQSPCGSYSCYIKLPWKTGVRRWRALMDDQFLVSLFHQQVVDEKKQGAQKIKYSLRIT